MYTVFFVGGMPALIYQVVWQRVLTLYFGVDIYSTSITVSTFMLGLGLGSLLGGHIADRVERPGRMYAWCELGTAAFGAVSLMVFSAVGEALAGSSLAVILPVDFALLLVPTTLMGMTLPLMVKTAESQSADIGSHLSWLYGLNTLGAAVGALTTAWFLVGILGFAGATYLAAGLNLVLGLVMLRLSSTSAQGHAAELASPDAEGAEDPTPSATTSMPIVFTLSLLSGLVGLGYEVVWYRLLTVLLHGTPYVFGTILTVFLAFMALGSIRARKVIDQPRPLDRFAWSQLVTAVYVFGSFTLLGRASWLPGVRHVISASMFTSFHPSLQLASGSYGVIQLYSLVDVFLWAAVIIALPAYCMGYGFPHLMRAASRSRGALGSSVGRVYFANILGSTAGSLLAGFVLLHYLGSEHTLAFFVGLGCLTGLVVLWPRRAVGGARRRALVYAGVLVMGGTVVVFPGRGQLLRAFHLAHFDSVEFSVEEDRTGIVAMRRQNAVVAFSQEQRIVGERRIYIDGARHGRFGVDEQTEVQDDIGVRLALSAARGPRRVLSVGLGDGKMVATALRWPGVEEVVVVELNGALRTVLNETVQGRFITQSSKLRYIVDDGRRWLLAHPDEQFDLVIEFPLHAAHAFSGNLYSKEFFTLARSHLSDHGVFMIRTGDAYSTARTLATVFDDVVRAKGHSYIAAAAPLGFDHSTLGVTPDELLTYLEADRETILEKTSGVPLNTDFAPNSEYYMTYAHTEVLISRELYQTEPHARLSSHLAAP